MNLILIALEILIGFLWLAIINMKLRMNRGLREVSSAVNRLTAWFQEQDELSSPYRNGAQSDKTKTGDR